MASRREAPDALDFFPTPPWATRALLEHVYPFQMTTALQTCWEPAAGEGHMAEVLRPYFRAVHASDVHDYGRGYAQGSFVGEGLDVAECPFDPDWIITNPPFNLALPFAARAIVTAKRGVALLVRTSWLEGVERFNELFHATPPWRVGLFVERVPMVKGRWDPAASTATSYAWIVWRTDIMSFGTELVWIPPGCRQALTYHEDVNRFGPAPEAGPSLFDEALA
ncbi:MAG: SAM-dependent DNA methyltransferase [Hyphomicrobiaceae bacterium]